MTLLTLWRRRITAVVAALTRTLSARVTDRAGIVAACHEAPGIACGRMHDASITCTAISEPAP